MSEVRAEYHRCAAGANLHADCLTRRSGDLVEIIGHPAMLFTASDATKLAVAINRIAIEIREEQRHE